METQSPTPVSSETPEPYYGFRFPETNGDVTVMDQVSPYPPEFVESFFKTERCLITRACQPPKVYQPCTDILPRTMAWLAAGVPTDFIDRVAINLGRWELSEAEAEAPRCDFCHCVHEPDAPGFEACAAELESMYQPERHR